jgi:arginine N-succinyltransferase
MFLIRAVKTGDLADLLGLARHLDSCNLPHNRLLLQKLIKQSLKSFQGRVEKKEDRRFLFVAENKRIGKIVGCSLIIGRHGTSRLPQLAFKIGRETKRSRSLGKSVRHTTLQLVQDKVGRTEVGGLVVLPRYRKHKQRIGTQLSFMRFAYMAVHQNWFCKKLLVEYIASGDLLRGNALWKGIGNQFLHLDYHRADRLSIKNKEFMLSLLPKEKIYCTLFSPEIQKVVGTPGAGGKVSLGMLKKLGFKFLEQVDPFDGGPYYGAELKKVALVKRTRKERFASSGTLDLTYGLKAVVLHEIKGEVRGCISDYKIQKGKVRLPDLTKRLLKLEENDQVILTPLGGLL